MILQATLKDSIKCLKEVRITTAGYFVGLDNHHLKQTSNKKQREGRKETDQTSLDDSYNDETYTSHLKPTYINFN